MRVVSSLRLSLRSLAIAAAVACVPCAGAAGAPGTAGAADAPPDHTVKDPHYGDTLFEFFQDRYFSSVTGLMASQQLNRVARHADEAEVLRGGMLLSYGLHREAGKIFGKLIEGGAKPKVRDRAWFYLAKIRYQRGYLAEAETALANVGDKLPANLQEDRALLQSNLSMARADYAGAAAVLSAVGPKIASARYAKFNLGIALTKAGDLARATQVLDELGRAPAEDEEYRALRDRANVALGFTALANNEPQAARTYLERVRLKSLQANKALLGFGWAAAALKEPRLALVPWVELAGRDVGDSAALEAQIAVPYAYAELGATSQSLAGYNAAIETFARENTALDESISAIRTGTMVQALFNRNPGSEMGWFWRLGDLPEMPHASHLSQLLAQHELQEAFKNYRDLRFLAKNLDDWRDKLVVFDDMLATRRKAFAERLPQVRARASETGLVALRQQRDALAAEITRGESDADGCAFADAKQLDLLARAERVNALVAGNEPELVAARSRARLAAGALTWQLAQGYTERLWVMKKNLNEIDTQITEAQRRDAALGEAQLIEPRRFDEFGQRIAALTPRLGVMIPLVATLTREQQVAVQDIAVAELSRQKERLAAYTTQARFALAQMYDRANAAGDKKSGTKADAKDGEAKNSDAKNINAKEGEAKEGEARPGATYPSQPERDLVSARR